MSPAVPQASDADVRSDRSGGPVMDSESEIDFYCPKCQQPVNDPLVCGDCASLICRRCGTPLERADELGIG